MPEHPSISNSTIIITGLIRDGAKTISREVENLTKAFANFRKVSFLVIESDSSDTTIKILSDLKSKVSSFEYETLGTLVDKFPNRIDRLSYCRKIAHSIITKSKEPFDYVCVADLDGVNNLLNTRAVESCWDDPTWDVCTANQDGPYYDIFALREKHWCPNDSWEEHKVLIQQGIHPMRARKLAIFSKQLVIPETSNYIEVESSFGGLGIYTWEAFKLGNYSSRDSNGAIVCEHVLFNRPIRDAGKRIVINPALINSKGYDLRRFDRRLKYFLKYALSFIAPKLFLKWIG